MKNIILTITILIGIKVIGNAQKVGLGTITPNNTLEVISEVNTNQGSLATILGTNTGVTGNAIWGNSSATNTTGIIGTSTAGYGVQGYTNNNIAINALSLSGYGLRASSSVGYALQVSGKLKFAGGNTNPSDDAVLTSDAVGNATWKKSNIAFLGVGTTQSIYQNGIFKKVEFTTESYDLQANFLDYNNGNTPSTSSTFTASVSGIYHFSSNINFYKNNVSNYYFSYAEIRLVKNGVTIASYTGHPYISLFTESNVSLQIAGNFKLNVNDKIWIEAAPFSGSGGSSALDSDTDDARFSGHLVVAD